MPSSPSSSSSSLSSSSSSSRSNQFSINTNSNPNPNHSVLCRRSPFATLDLLILILVIFAGAFLIVSYLSYIFTSFTLFLSLSHSSIYLPNFSLPYLLGFCLFFGVVILLFQFCCGVRSRKCDKPGCKGTMKAMEFDLKLQTEECVQSGSKEIDKLPWKGGSEGNPDYECLRAELRKMAPPNGRAILLFQGLCGCPVAKLEGWGVKRRKQRHKISA